MMVLKIVLLIIAVSVFSYFIITTVVDIALMGRLSFCFSTRPKSEKFLIKKENRIDIQDGFKCSGFSSSFVLRHFDIQAEGNDAYRQMPLKMKNGYVYPKGIRVFLQQKGFSVKYKKGNISALKNSVSKGAPVIVMIKIRTDKNWLHYVPVVGYDEENIFIAESLSEFANCSEPHHNRKIPVKEFKKLWNTTMPKMPLYANTFFEIEK